MFINFDTKIIKTVFFLVENNIDCVGVSYASLSCGRRKCVVRLSVRRSVRLYGLPSVHPSVNPSVRPKIVKVLLNVYMTILTYWSFHYNVS